MHQWDSVGCGLQNPLQITSNLPCFAHPTTTLSLGSFGPGAASPHETAWGGPARPCSVEGDVDQELLHLLYLLPLFETFPSATTTPKRAVPSPEVFGVAWPKTARPLVKTSARPLHNVMIRSR